MIPNSGRNVAIVAIGRNEGERLKSCLESTVEPGRTVVYVDSGSKDSSVKYSFLKLSHLKRPMPEVVLP